MITAANAFLATLTDDPKGKVVYEFFDNQARQTWSNFPVSTVPREGLAIGDLSDESRTAALALVKTMSGDDGAAQINQIRKADNYLASIEQGNQSIGEDTYHIAIYGTPRSTHSSMNDTLWRWRRCSLCLRAAEHSGALRT